MIFVFSLLLGGASANIGFANAPIYSVYEWRLSELLATHRASKSLAALACNEQLMEFAASMVADFSDKSIVSPSVDAWAGPLKELSGVSKFDHEKASLVLGVAYDSPVSFWNAVKASDSHLKEIESTEFNEVGVAYEPLNGFWLIIVAKHKAGVTRPSVTACPSLETTKLFVPVTDAAQMLRQVSIGAPDDIIATDASGALVRKYHPCFGGAGNGGAGATCANSAVCCAVWSLGMAPPRGASWVGTSLDSTCYAAATTQSSAPDLYRRKPVMDGKAAMMWDRVNGSFVKVYVGGAGVVYGISTQKNLYKLDVASGKWAVLPGQWAHASVGADGSLWAIDHANGRVLRRQNGTWVYIKGKLDHIAVGDRDNVWGIGTDDGQIYAYAGDAVGWRRFNASAIDPMSGQRARYLSVGATSYELWVLDTSGSPLRLARPDLATALLDGKMGAPMAASADDSLHLTNATDVPAAALPDDDMTAFTLNSSAPINEPVTPIGGPRSGRSTGLAPVTTSVNPATTAAPSSNNLATGETSGTTSVAVVAMTTVVAIVLLGAARL
jgi:hypothetical protein